jgi:uncharacterized damage-inducible protein DinB
MTIFFRKLSEIKKQQTIEDAFELIKESFYKIEEVDKTEDAWMYWFTQYLNRLQQESLTDTDRKADESSKSQVCELHVAISH